MPPKANLPLDLLSEKRDAQARRHALWQCSRPARVLRVRDVCATLVPNPMPSQEAVAQQHNDYLQKHPEIQKILNDFVSAALVEQPADVFHFAREHFAPQVPETAKAE